MSFEARMEQLDTDITSLEGAEPFVITQAFAPNQKDWEAAWVAAGNILPIPTFQELYWKDDFALRGEFKTLPDQFSLLARSKAEGFEIRDIAGWEDEEHLIVFVVRDDPDAPQGCCRMYLDGTLEEITFPGFTPEGLLGFSYYTNRLWYYEGLNVKRLNLGSGAAGTIFTVVAGGLPEWRFFVFADTDTEPAGDVMFGAKIGVDADRSLYYYNFAPASLTKVMTTFNPGGGAVRPDRPLAFTQDYVFLAEPDSRAGFDGNKLHQITRSGYTWQTEVDNGITTGDEVRTIISKTDYLNNTIEVLTGHLLPAIPKAEWNQLLLWNAATQTATASMGQPHNAMLQILRQNMNDHNLDYHQDTRLYYDPEFVADGGSEIHYNSIGGILWNTREDRFLIYDQGWHTWTNADAPDLYVYAHPENKLYDIYLNPDDYPIGTYPGLYAPLFPLDFTIDSYTQSTRKVYRVSDWSQFDDDIIIIAEGVLVGAQIADTIDVSNVPADYGLFEVIREVYQSAGGQISLMSAGDNRGSHLNSSATIALNQRQNDSNSIYAGSELSTSASVAHKFVFRRKFSANYEIEAIDKGSVRTATLGYIHTYWEGLYLVTGSQEITSIIVSVPDNNLALPTNRYIVRAWRTVPRMKTNGADYDPGMA